MSLDSFLDSVDEAFRIGGAVLGGITTGLSAAEQEGTGVLAAGVQGLTAFRTGLAQQQTAAGTSVSISSAPTVGIDSTAAAAGVGSPGPATTKVSEPLGEGTKIAIGIALALIVAKVII